MKIQFWVPLAIVSITMMIFSIQLVSLSGIGANQIELLLEQLNPIRFSNLKID